MSATLTRTALAYSGTFQAINPLDDVRRVARYGRLMGLIERASERERDALRAGDPERATHWRAERARLETQKRDVGCDIARRDGLFHPKDC